MMSQELFLDSSALFAFVDRDQKSGATVVSYLKEIRRPLITTNLIFAESLSLITKRLGKKVGIETGLTLRKSEFARVITLDEAIRDEAWALYQKYQDKDFDFIDATSFIFCRRRKINEVLTLDRHFQQMGFVVVP